MLLHERYSSKESTLQAKLMEALYNRDRYKASERKKDWLCNLITANDLSFCNLVRLQSKGAIDFKA